MYHSILVPVGLSENNAIAVERVGQVARPKEAAVTLLHVIETVQDVPFEELSAFYETLREKAERVLADWMKVLTAGGFDVHSEIIYGKRGEEIVGYAEEHDVDLIIMRSSSLDRSNLAGSFGGLSHQVALLAPCSVLLVRQLTTS